MSEILYIVRHHVVTVIEECCDASSIYQCETSTRRGSVCDIWMTRISCHLEYVGDVVVYLRLDVDALADICLHLYELFTGEWRFRFLLFFGCFTMHAEDSFLILGSRIGEHYLHKKSIQLRFWERIRPFVFERILCRDDEKWRGKCECLIAYSDLVLLHGFEEGRLYLRWSTIYLIGEEYTRKNRSLSHLELRCLWTVYLSTSEVCREEIGSE